MGIPWGMKGVLQPACVIGLILLALPLRANDSAVVATIRPTDLLEFASQPPQIQFLIEKALELTQENLYYRFGSNSPRLGGMDCSGAIQYTLIQAGVSEVPRSSHKIYQWANDNGSLISTRGAGSLDDPIFDQLKPGDLLFWEGTYAVKERNPPISHVMIYLGRHKLDGLPIMFGSSDGRHYRRQRINGVSVFDWKIPRPQDRSKFVAYGPIPGPFNVQDEVPSATSGWDGRDEGFLRALLKRVFR